MSMAAFSYLQNYGSDSDSSESVDDQRTGEMTLHLQPLKQNKSFAPISSAVAVVSAPVVATKVSPQCLSDCQTGHKFDQTSNKRILVQWLAHDVTNLRLQTRL